MILNSAQKVFRVGLCLNVVQYVDVLVCPLKLFNSSIMSVLRVKSAGGDEQLTFVVSLWLLTPFEMLTLSVLVAPYFISYFFNTSFILFCFYVCV